MRSYDKEYLNELAAKAKKESEHDSKAIKTRIKADMDSSEDKTRRHQLLFAFCVARNKDLWERLAEPDKEGGVRAIVTTVKSVFSFFLNVSFLLTLLK